MQKEEPYLSIVVPVYNAESFLEDALGELDAYLTRFGKTVELILVDDGSRDSSEKIIREFASKPHVYKVIHLANKKNRGKGFTVAYGMLSASGKYRVFIDCDLAYPPSEIYKIVDSLERGFDVVVACRVDKDSRYTISPAFFRYLYTRHLMSRFLNWLLRRLLLPLCRDSHAGLKGFTAEAAEKIFKRQKIHGFSFDSEVLYLADRMGMLVEEVAVDYRYFDEPSTVTFIKDSLGVLRDIVRIKLYGFMHKYKLPSEEERVKRLIVNADDYALSENISRGIIDAFKNGFVKSVSVMSNTVALDKSIDLLKEAPGLDTGIHFVLTYGMPLLDPSEVPSLAGSNGLFYGRISFYLRWLTGRINLDEVYRELSEQLKVLKEKGLEITHIDSHHHIHILPGIRDVVARIALENNIRYVRAPRGHYRGFNIGALIRQWAASIFVGSYPQYWHRKGIHAVENFSGFQLKDGEGLLKRWKQFLRNLPSGTTEVMVHPGFLDEELKDSYKGGRVEELKVMKNAELMSMLRNLGIELVSYKELL